MDNPRKISTCTYLLDLFSCFVNLCWDCSFCLLTLLPVHQLQYDVIKHLVTIHLLVCCVKAILKRNTNEENTCFLLNFQESDPKKKETMEVSEPPTAVAS